MIALWAQVSCKHDGYLTRWLGSYSICPTYCMTRWLNGISGHWALGNATSASNDLCTLYRMIRLWVHELTSVSTASMMTSLMMSTGRTCLRVWELEGPGSNFCQCLLMACLWNKECSGAIVCTPHPLIVAVLTLAVNCGNCHKMNPDKRYPPCRWLLGHSNNQGSLSVRTWRSWFPRGLKWNCMFIQCHFSL